MKTTRIMMHAQGGPEVMQLEEADLAASGAGEVQIEQTAIGLNYMDIYQRSGAYKMVLPSPLGLEAAGHVLAIGADVEGFTVGDRVAYGPVLGAYATHRNVPAARLVKIPDDISDEIAAAVLMKGTTVEYLLNRTHKVSKNEDVLFWAASGGVGQLAGQWGAYLGARMIGVEILALAFDQAVESVHPHLERVDIAQRRGAVPRPHLVQVIVNDMLLALSVCPLFVPAAPQHELVLAPDPPAPVP
jgi:D-arabinose 1-dehydrogenase-like Zn-dependent alcohol dehydrogenase